MNLAQTNYERIDFSNEDVRVRLSRVVTNLFSRWELSSEDQLSLLGLSSSSRAMLSKYRQGKPLSASRDTLDRVGWLLAIHKALRLLYPRNEQIRYSWVKRPNRAFENLPPLSLMFSQGIIGIAKVSRYLDMQRGH